MTEPKTFTLIELDPQGNVLWERHQALAVIRIDDSIAFDGDRSAVMMGRIFEGRQDEWAVFKLDESGRALWSAELGNPRCLETSV